MKGKIAFVLGAAVGYVLGSRAGRARYEQIKSGAAKVWNTEPVQRGVGFVRGRADDAVDEALGFVRRASADAFAGFVNRAEDQRQRRGSDAPEASSAPAGDTEKAES